MYSRWLHWNHRLRLTALLTATVSVSLAIVFLFVMVLVREQALQRRFLDLETSVQSISHEPVNRHTLREVKEDFPGLDVAVFSPNGELLESTTQRTLPFVEGRLKKGDSLTYGIRIGSTVVVGVTSWAETEAGLRQLAWVLAGLWLPLILLTAGVSWYCGGLVLRPVKELVVSAQRLSGASEGEALATTDRAEFASLTESLNQLIARVRHAASLQEQFASDAAHELRTPLALLRTRIETNLQRDRTPQEHIASQSAMLKQIERLTSIVETLLCSARQQARDSVVVDFGSAVRAAVEDWAESRDWPAARIRVETQSCRAQISHGEVAIVVRNVLDNGARHSPENSALEVKVVSTGGQIELTVRDFGHGLTDEEMARAFERFYRSDEGRGRQEGGSGIGLAVVKRIVQAAGGEVGFVPVDSGALISLTLPVADDANQKG